MKQIKKKSYYINKDQFVCVQLYRVNKKHTSLSKHQFIIEDTKAERIY